MRYLLFLFLLCFGSCIHTENNKTKELLIAPIVQQLRASKVQMDSLYKNNTKQLVHYIKKEKTLKPLLVLEDTIDDVACEYIFQKDTLGNLISATEFPVSKSGDWYIVYTHYFDKQGKTFAFESQVNFFRACAEGVAYETKTRYYDETFHIIDTTYILVDENNKSLVGDSCSTYFYKPCVIYNCEKTYLQANHVKLYIKTNEN